jgi:glycopeptide antibiotics resistance protein
MNDVRPGADNSQTLYWSILLLTLAVFLLGTLGFDASARGPDYNLVPVRRILHNASCLLIGCERPPHPFFFVLNLVGNALILAPLGFSLFHLTENKGLSRRQRIWLGLLVGLILSLGVETMQLLHPGRFSDVDDVLLNGLGALMGAWIASRQGQSWCLARVVARKR